MKETFTDANFESVWILYQNMHGYDLTVAMTLGGLGYLDLHPSENTRGSGAEVEAIYYAAAKFGFNPRFTD
jgi:hypothetical protein